MVSRVNYSTAVFADVPSDIKVSGVSVNGTYAMLNRSLFETPGKNITTIKTIGAGRFDTEACLTYPVIVVTYNDGSQARFDDPNPSGYCQAVSAAEIAAQEAERQREKEEIARQREQELLQREEERRQREEERSKTDQIVSNPGKAQLSKYLTLDTADLGYCIVTVSESIQPHSDGPDRYDRVKQMSSSCLFVSSSSAAGYYMQSGTEGGLGVGKKPEIRFEFTNPKKPETRAVLERYCDGKVSFQNYFTLGIDVPPTGSHKRYFTLLINALEAEYKKLDKKMPTNDLVITPLCNDGIWHNQKRFSELKVTDI